MKTIWDNVKQDFFFWFFSLISVVFLMIGICFPPPGEIHNSVLIAVSELFGFATLGTVLKAINSGIHAKLKHKDTEVEIEGKKKEDRRN